MRLAVLISFNLLHQTTGAIQLGFHYALGLAAMSLLRGVAAINEPGGAQVLFRHTPASIMVLNGCDLLTIQHILRHSDIKTTMRYLHLADESKRERYDQFLKL